MARSKTGIDVVESFSSKSAGPFNQVVAQYMGHATIMRSAFCSFSSQSHIGEVAISHLCLQIETDQHQSWSG